MENDDIPTLIAEEKLKAAGDGFRDANEDEDFEDIDDDDDDDDEEMDNSEPTTCLFCETVLPTIEQAMAHLRQTHKVDFSALKAKFAMDQYAFIKLINCIRTEGVSAEKVATAQQIFWDDEKYLKPKAYEPWLSYDYDELPAAQTVTNKNDESVALRALVRSLQQQVHEQAQLLQQAAEDMSTMRASFHRLLEKETTTQSTTNSKTKAVNSVASVSLQADASYFSSYAHFGIHHEMLSDVVRTISYRDALLLNKAYVSGKDVLDVGCGTSVLSIFASQAGAKSVVGIDNSDVIYNAMDIVKLNDITNVALIKGRLEDTELPQSKFDIIISEWMGYFLLFEGMLDSVIYARDHHLKEGGMLLPNRCTMSLVGYGNEALYRNHVTFWDNVYELKMSNMRKEVLHEPLIEIIDPAYMLTEPNIVADLNLSTIDLNYSNFTCELQLKCTKDGNLSAFVGYFDTYFDLPIPVMFSTGPTCPPTHWKQVVFFIEPVQPVKAGNIVKGKLVCHRSRNSARSLDITIKAFDRTFTYYLD